MIKMAKKNYTGPEEYRPLGAWAYFGYSILFSIPVIGLIVNLVFCFSDGNINRRNYARSFWCAYLFVAILAIAMIVIMTALGITADSIFDAINSEKSVMPI